MSKSKNALVRFREQAGLSQAAVATELGYTSPQFVSNWERGLSEPPPKKVEKLASMFGIRRSELAKLVMQANVDRRTKLIKQKYKAGAR